MASRPITAAQQAETAKAGLDPILLAELEFSSGIVRVWTGGGDLAWNGETWLGIGALATVSGITETLEVRAAGVLFELNGLDPALLALALGSEYQGRPARLWLGTLNAAGQVIAEPTLIFAGRMDVMGDEDDPDARSARIFLTAENHLADLRRPRVWRYTHEDQQRLFPADKGLEFVAALQNKQIVWR